MNHADGSGKTYLYENAAWPEALTGIVDERGIRYAVFAYDAQGRGTLSEYAGGAQRYAMSYGAGSASVTTPLGAQYQYRYDTAGGVRTVGNASAALGTGAGDMAARTQNPDGTIATETDFLGINTTYVWDAGRRLPLAETRAAGRPEAQTASTQWHPVYRLPVLVTEAGRSTAWTYDASGNKLSETVTDTATGQARTTAWTYNAQGLADTLTDAKGGIWRHAYDAAGNRVSVKNPLGQETRQGFDAAGRLTSRTYPGGLSTSYSYDARGRILTQVTGGEATRYSWTPNGQIASVSFPGGYQASYSYDAAQRLIAASDNRLNQVSYTLDAAGNRIREEVKDSSGTIAWVTSRVINSLNQLSAIQGATGQSTQIGYDANGEVISGTDPLNQTTRQSLDGLRRPTSTAFADGAVASQAWSQLDQLTSVTDPKGVQTRYERNAFGEVMRESSPDIGSISYERDALGDVVKKTDAKGNVTTITRDALGRPIEVRHSQDHIVHYSWSAAGHLSRMEDKSGSTAYERDLHGRITRKTQSVNDNPNSPSSFTTSYSYINGELTTVTYLHNALGQRVFKSEVEAEQAAPNDEELGHSFIDWLRKNFKWLFTRAHANASVGTAYVHGDGELPGWALLGEYDNGSAAGAGRTEYIWLPTPDGAIPVGMFRNGKLFAIHPDHLGTPRLMTNESNTPVWQWPYSAFGNNKPTGVLKATPKAKKAITNEPALLKATAPQQELNIRMPGQYFDVETGTPIRCSAFNVGPRNRSCKLCTLGKV